MTHMGFVRIKANNPVRENLLAFVQGKQMPHGKGPQDALTLYPQFVPDHADAVEGLLELLEAAQTVQRTVFNPHKEGIEIDDPNDEI